MGFLSPSPRHSARRPEGVIATWTYDVRPRLRIRKVRSGAESEDTASSISLSSGSTMLRWPSASSSTGRVYTSGPHQRRLWSIHGAPNGSLLRQELGIPPKRSRRDGVLKSCRPPPPLLTDPPD